MTRPAAAPLRSPTCRACARQRGLRVHDARIATFGEKVEDIFLLSDERDRAIDGQALDELREAIVAGVDGEH